MNIGIKYIGKKALHSDRLYGSKLSWEPGQIKNVSESIAKQMMVHSDIYEIVEADQKASKFIAEKEVEAEVKMPVPLPNLEGMSKAELQSFAQQHYGEKIHHAMSEANMRHKILTMIQSRGR